MPEAPAEQGGGTSIAVAPGTNCPLRYLSALCRCLGAKHLAERFRALPAHVFPWTLARTPVLNGPSTRHPRKAVLTSRFCFLDIKREKDYMEAPTEAPPPAQGPSRDGFCPDESAGLSSRAPPRRPQGVRPSHNRLLPASRRRTGRLGTNLPTLRAAFPTSSRRIRARLDRTWASKPPVTR